MTGDAAYLFQIRRRSAPGRARLPGKPSEAALMTPTVAIDHPAEPVAETAPQDAPRKRGGGPKTPEGRDRAKRNSLKHGMRAKEVFPHDLAATVQTCIDELVAAFRPTNAYEMRLVVDMGRATAQIDR